MNQLSPPKSFCGGGLLLINKPRGPTSFDIVRLAKKRLGTKKIGHAGTLDPFATGLLVLGVGEATKALAYLLKDDKEYITELELGRVSDTHDSEGVICAGKNIALSRAEIAESLKSFLGDIEQVPPQYSAVKIRGMRACDRMRRGEEVEIAPKQVIVHSLEILSYAYPILRIKIHCGSGFYVRSFARDLGEKLGTGAYCRTLERTKSGGFSLAEAIAPEEVAWEHVAPLAPAHFPFPSLAVSAAEACDLRLGKKITAQAENGMISVFCEKEIVCIGEIDDGVLQPKRVFTRDREERRSLS